MAESGIDRMSISDKTKKSLEKIGMTSYEIKTYTSLLKGGELNASELSQNSGVPYSKIYEVLGTLEEKAGLVQMTLDLQNISQNLQQLHLKQLSKTLKQNFQKTRIKF